MDKYKEFLRIAKHLNSELNIVPVLYGSLGLSRIVGKSLKPEDIDILVSQKYITTEWETLRKTLSRINYRLVDEKEHEFIRSLYKIGIAYEEDLLSYAKVDYKKLQTITDDGANYRVLDIKQYRKVYERSKDDSYRVQKNNKKDLEKIKLIDDFIKKASA